MPAQSPKNVGAANAGDDVQRDILPISDRHWVGLTTYDAKNPKTKYPPGKHQVRMEFHYDGGGLAKDGDVTLYYDGKQVGKGRVKQTIPMGYSADEGCDVDVDAGSPAYYGASGNFFTGEIDFVRIDIGDDDHSHLISPEERFNMAMAKQ